ncbi:hypothetical protein GCM10007079_03090 [Nocardiopsis terrae]|uniref:WXG100 family type VII secretion target n=1 Tax=Nocardiopsis terrae TaxID=372655 RepID=A0ABR9HMU5_9ACTN|nr:DUF6507 family protein [Nocardiopsis terrae]MBE1460360.1 hypothetical protein [Nocardiopsis terrae]GHC71039.1 hypothetical protein GCM10007079_03090 [Nocardiopsis terrae]
MGSWDVNPQQVGAVLTETAGHIGEEGGTEGLLGHMNQLETRVTALNNHINSAPIGIALGEFAEHYFGMVGDMLSLTASAVQGTSEATTFYVEGDREMASEAQGTAGTIPDPPPPPTPPPGVSLT